MSISKCTKCGLCKVNCPILKITHNETHGPRGKSLLLKNEKMGSSFFLCTLCGACKTDCPIDINLPEEIRKAREKIARSGKDLESNKKMIKNIEDYGNPFGKIDKENPPKDLYCC